MTENHGYDTWRGRVDDDMREMGERLSGVETGISSLGKSFDKFTHSFELNIERQRDMSRPQYAVMIGALTLAVVILGGIGGAVMSGYVRDLSRIETDVSHIRNNRKSAADPVQDVQIKVLMEALEKVRMEEHRTLTRDASMVERIRAIERKIHGKPGGHLHDTETHHGD